MKPDEITTALDDLWRTALDERAFATAAAILELQRRIRVEASAPRPLPSARALLRRQLRAQLRALGKREP